MRHIGTILTLILVLTYYGSAQDWEVAPALRGNHNLELRGDSIFADYRVEGYVFDPSTRGWKRVEHHTEIIPQQSGVLWEEKASGWTRTLDPRTGERDSIRASPRYIFAFEDDLFCKAVPNSAPDRVDVSWYRGAGNESAVLWATTIRLPKLAGPENLQYLALPTSTGDLAVYYGDTVTYSRFGDDPIVRRIPDKVFRTLAHYKDTRAHCLQDTFLLRAKSSILITLDGGYTWSTAISDSILDDERDAHHHVIPGTADVIWVRDQHRLMVMKANGTLDTLDEGIGRHLWDLETDRTGVMMEWTDASVYYQPGVGFMDADGDDTGERLPPGGADEIVGMQEGIVAFERDVLMFSPDGETWRRRRLDSPIREDKQWEQGSQVLSRTINPLILRLGHEYGVFVEEGRLRIDVFTTGMYRSIVTRTDGQLWVIPQRSEAPYELQRVHYDGTTVEIVDASVSPIELFQLSDNGALCQLEDHSFLYYDTAASAWRPTLGLPPLFNVQLGDYNGHAGVIRGDIVESGGQFRWFITRDHGRSWDTIRSWDGAPKPFTVRLDPFGNLITVFADQTTGGAVFTDVTTGERLTPTHPEKWIDQMHSFTFSTDGAWLYTCSDDPTGRIYRYPYTPPVVSVDESPAVSPVLADRVTGIYDLRGIRVCAECDVEELQPGVYMIQHESGVVRKVLISR